MRIGVAEARRRFREILERVRSGEVVEIARRGKVIATVSPPEAGGTRGRSFEDELSAWRSAWGVESWPDDDPFEQVRDASEGRGSPW